MNLDFIELTEDGKKLWEAQYGNKVWRIRYNGAYYSVSVGNQERQTWVDLETPFKALSLAQIWVMENEFPLWEVYIELKDGYPEEAVEELLEFMREVKGYWKRRAEYIAKKKANGEDV